MALGNFDGVHLGHQALVASLVEKARENKGTAGAFIFEPHPAQVLTPHNAPKLLVTPELKACLLQKMGLDILIYNVFTRDIAAWSPEKFVKEILVKRLQVSEVFVGFNYSFGHKGAGSPESLREMGKDMGFAVNVIPPVTLNGEVVSSSAVRKALEHGDIKHAFEMLGYYPVLQGMVIEGEHRGSQIGFPTANIGVERLYNVPGKGVYAAKAKVRGELYNAVVNIGSKPTFHDNYPISIEAHLMDFKQQIYGEEIDLYFIQKLRDEQKFNSIQELVRQIGQDRDKAFDLAGKIKNVL